MTSADTLDIDFEGRIWHYRPAEMDLKTAMVVKAHTGRGLVSWNAGVEDMDPVAVQALWWVVRRQNSVNEPGLSELDFEVIRFWDAFQTAATEMFKAKAIAHALRIRERGEEGEDVDPTGPGTPGLTPEPTPTSAPSETATSSPSPTSAASEPVTSTTSPSATS